jgi:hypothetical protein
MPYDYTNAPPQRDFGLFPDGTIATLSLHIRPGNVGEDGMLTRSEKGDCEMLDLEFVVTDGKYKGRKLWGYWVLAGTTPGHAQAADITRARLRAIIESALGLDPKDESDKARAARTLSLGQFNGICFIGEIGVEKGKPNDKKPGENWPDKNVITKIVTLADKKDWHPVEQPPDFNGGGVAQAAPPSAASLPAAPPIEKPRWAT